MKRTREIINWIEANHPATIKFEVDMSIVASISLYLESQDYEALIFMYGILFGLALLEYFSEAEMFEECVNIHVAIDEINHTLKGKLPKSLNDEASQRMLHLSPIEIYNLSLSEHENV